MNIMFNKLNILAILSATLLLISCDNFTHKKALMVAEVQFSGMLPGKACEGIGIACAEFNEHKYVVNGIHVYTAPSLNGYLIIYHGFPNDPKIPEFVRSHFKYE
jgi:hypothetical protein